MTIEPTNKPKLVLDTNIYISAIHFGGLPLRLINLAPDEKISLFISRNIITEILGVLRQKFSYSPTQLDQIETLILDTCYLVAPQTRVSTIKADLADNRILECALEAKADFIVSGDKKHLLKLKKFHSIPIVTPAELLKKLVQ